jgi:hypothetical protein
MQYTLMFLQRHKAIHVQVKYQLQKTDYINLTNKIEVDIFRQYFNGKWKNVYLLKVIKLRILYEVMCN